MDHVYIDVFVVFNFIMNLMLLWATGVLLRLKVNWWQLGGASFVGTVYSLGIFYPGVSFLYGFAGKVLVSLIMIWLACAPLKRYVVLRAFGCFYLVSFLAAGMSFAVASFFGYPYSNNGGSFEMAILALLAATAVGSLARFEFWSSFRKWRWQGSFDLQVEVCFEDKRAQARAILDTGNRLKDPLSGWPVLVLQLNAAKGLIPGFLMSMIQETNFDKLVSNEVDEKWRTRLRVVPYTSIGKQDGLLVGFRPDLVVIRSGQRVVETSQVIVALYDRPLSRNDHYEALCPLDLGYRLVVASYSVARESV